MPGFVITGAVFCEAWEYSTMNKFFRYGLGTLSAFAVLAGHSAFAENFVARMSGHWSPKHQSAIHSQIFADEVTKRSDGRLTIQFYPSKQLFGIREVMGAVGRCG